VKGEPPIDALIPDFEKLRRTPGKRRTVRRKRSVMRTPEVHFTDYNNPSQEGGAATPAAQLSIAGIEG